MIIVSQDSLDRILLFFFFFNLFDSSVKALLFLFFFLKTTITQFICVSFSFSLFPLSRCGLGFYGFQNETYSKPAGWCRFSVLILILLQPAFCKLDSPGLE